MTRKMIVLSLIPSLLYLSQEYITLYLLLALTETPLKLLGLYMLHIRRPQAKFLHDDSQDLELGKSEFNH